MRYTNQIRVVKMPLSSGLDDTVNGRSKQQQRDCHWDQLEVHQDLQELYKTHENDVITY